MDHVLSATAATALPSGPFTLGTTRRAPGPAAARQLLTFTEQGFGALPVCIAKTPYSFTADEHVRGAVTGFTLPIREARLAAGGGPPLYIGLVMRSMSIVRDTIARVDAGQLGQVISIDATEHLPPEHGGYLARNWRRKQAYGGSYLLDKVCHDFDIFGRLTRSRPAKVASFGGRNIFTPDRAGHYTYSDGQLAYALRDAGWASANDAFHSDMDVTDHQNALVQYENGVRLSFHANSHVALPERRWYVAGTEGTLIADLVRNKLMVRRAMDRGKPERIDYGDRTEDSHNGADQAMARDLLATMEGRQDFPVTPFESMEAGLTVMAIDEAMTLGEMLDCAPMWARYDAARGA